MSAKQPTVSGSDHTSAPPAATVAATGTPQHVASLDATQALLTLTDTLNRYERESRPDSTAREDIEKARASVRALYLRVVTLESAASELLIDEHDNHDATSHAGDEQDSGEDCPICQMRRVLVAGFTTEADTTRTPVPITPKLTAEDMHNG